MLKIVPFFCLKGDVNIFLLSSNLSLFFTFYRFLSSLSSFLHLSASPFLYCPFFCLYIFFIFKFLFFCLFRAAPVTHGGSQARGPIRPVASSLLPGPQQCGIQAESATYTTAHINAGSLTHWARSEIEPATSLFLVGFVNHCAMMGTPPVSFLN